MPILDGFGLRANQNIIVSSVETGRPPFAVAVADALAAADDERIRDLRIDGFGPALERGALDRARYGIALTNYLKMLPPSEREPRWAPVRQLLNEFPARTPMMTAEDVVDADAAGHQIGCHSYSHESMEHLTGEQVEHELDVCSRFFDRHGLENDVFAFPNGSYRPEQIAQLQRRGYRHVLTIGRPATWREGVHPRTAIYGSSDAELRLRAAAGV